MRVSTETAFPQLWADTQFNIALLRDEQGNRAAAVEAMHLALRGYRACGDVRNAAEVEEWLRENTL